jgi:hypothetical protein
MKKYLLSFTTGSFMLNETQKIASLYLEYKDWKTVDQQIFDENILQKNKLATKKRQLQEIKKRLLNLSDNAIKELMDFDSGNKKMIMLLATIKTYQFILEFIVEVIRPKWIQFDDEILDSDYDRFVNEKEELHTELANLSDKTKAKIKQVLFRILAEAGLIDSVKTRRIVQPYVAENIVELIVKENPDYLKAFLFSDVDVERYKEKYHINEN